MFRPLLVLLILLGVLCKPHALAGQIPPEPRLVGAASHLTLHAQKKAHHHHEDGSIGVDDSRESIQHVAVDGASGAVVDFSSNPFAHFGDLPSVLRAAEQRPAPEPVLPGLKRPPRLRA